MNTIRLNTKLIRSLSDVLFMTAADIMKATGIKQTTWYAVKKKPEDITVQQLLAIANGLHIPVRRFFSSEGAILIGKRDDYIMESYTECSYDADALQELVSNHADMTWKKAADATGISYDNLRKSLLAVRKTPVDRFLMACEAFRIDPFVILIDRNPEKKPKGKHTNAAAAGNAELAAIRQQLATMNAAVSDITAKYEGLLQRHTALLDRHNELERRFNDLFRPSIDMAAESGDD